MATKTTMKPVTNKPTRVMPRWLFMDALSLEPSDATRLAEIEPDEERFPHDVLVRNEPPHAAVRGIVAVVAHHEEVAGRNRAAHALGIVVAIFAERERPGKRYPGGSVAFLQDGVLDAAQRLLVLRRVMDTLAVEIVGDLLPRLQDSVDREPLVLVDDLVPRDPHDALDVVDRRVLGKAEHHHVAPLGLPDRDDLLVDEGEPYAVRELVDEDEVADEQRRHHRSRGNLERLHHERAQQEHDQDNREEALGILDPPGLLVVLAPLLAEVDAVGQCEGAREQQQDEQYQRKIHHRRSSFSLLVLDLQYRKESLLGYLHRAHLLHALLARLLLLEQLALARDIAAVALRQHVLAQRLDRLARDDMRAYCRLHRDVEHLARDQLAHAGDEVPAAVGGVLAVDHEGEGVDPLAVDEDVELHHVGRAVLLELVVERRVPAARRLELVEEIHHHLGERHLVGQHHLAPVVLHVALHAALLRAQRDDGADVLLRDEDGGLDDRLADLLDLRRIRKLRRILDRGDRPVAQHDLVHDRGGRSDERHLVLALEALLHDIHVQQAEEPAAKTEAERLRRLRLVVQRRVV